MPDSVRRSPVDAMAEIVDAARIASSPVCDMLDWLFSQPSLRRAVESSPWSREAGIRRPHVFLGLARRARQDQGVRVTVRLFAGLRERAGRSRLEIEDVARIEDVWPRLDLGTEPPGLLYAVNREYVEPGRELADGDEVA